MTKQVRPKLAESIAELVANPPLRSGFPCKVSTILAELDDENDRRALSDLIDNSKVSASAVARLLVGYGYQIKDPSIAKHRRRFDGTGCRCGSKPSA